MIEHTEEQKNLVNRHASRFIAVLSLYSCDVNEQTNLNQVMQEMLKSYFNKDIFYFNEIDECDVQAPDEVLLKQLLELNENKKDEIEELIKQNLIEKYSFAKLDRVIKSILKLIATELLFFGDIPAKVIIDEYVGLTKVFYEKKEAGFVNKVADIIARIVRKHEIM